MLPPSSKAADAAAPDAAGPDMDALALLRLAGGTVARLLYPPHCVQCGKPTPEGECLCRACLDGAKRIQPPFCEVCSQPFDGEMDDFIVCSNCHDRRFSFSCAVSAYRSRGVVREFMHRFKYEGESYLRRPLARWLAEALDDARIREKPFDFFVPVPLHPLRLRTREFNQAEVLARLLSRDAGPPVLNCLRRVRNTPTQTRLDREQRMENLRNAFEMRKNADVRGRHLLVVDDVFTTGSTVEACSRVLNRAGAASVRAITIARG